MGKGMSGITNFLDVNKVVVVVVGVVDVGCEVTEAADGARGSVVAFSAATGVASMSRFRGGDPACCLGFDSDSFCNCFFELLDFCDDTLGGVEETFIFDSFRSCVRSTP